MPNNSTATDVICFLFDKRLELFNTRRDHEWRVVFGVLILLGAVDASLLSKPICLSHNLAISWQISILCLGAASVAYELGVQARNRVDRRVMDRLQALLCDSIGLDSKNLIRVCVDSETEGHLGSVKSNSLFHLTYIWAFLCQVLTLFLACAVSLFIPKIACGLIR